MIVNAKITSDNATPEIAELMARVKPERLANICRQPLETFWRQKLKNYPRLPGKFASFPDTGYGEAASRSVIATVTGSNVRLDARQIGLNLRLKGGTIRPVNKKVLCFPISAESYNKSVYDFGYMPGDKSPAQKLVREKIRKLFAFARSITFRPNPDVRPTDDELQEVGMAAIQRSLAA